MNKECLQIELRSFLVIGKGVVLFILLFNSFDLFGQSNVNKLIENDTLIYWNLQRKLSWGDFLGKPDSTLTTYGSGKASAVTSAPLECRFNMHNGQVGYDIHCYFLKSNSWVRDTSSLLLVHEQLHFDIAELFARKMNKALQELQKQNITSYTPYVKAANKIVTDRGQYEKNYDKATFHGIIPFKQEEWNKKVKAELEELEEYKIDYTKYLKKE